MDWHFMVSGSQEIPLYSGYQGNGSGMSFGVLAYQHVTDTVLLDFGRWGSAWTGRLYFFGVPAIWRILLLYDYRMANAEYSNPIIMITSMQSI